MISLGGSISPVMINHIFVSPAQSKVNESKVNE